MINCINNDFTDDQRIITVDSSNTINTQYYNYLNKLNNAGYIQMVDNNPIPSLFNQIFGLELSNNQLCIGLVTTSINNILTKNYYLTKKESEINNQNQIKFLQFFTYLLGGTVENKKIIDKIKDKIFTTHITLDIDENIQPVKAKKVFEEIFYELQNEIYPDYWLEIIQILENYPKEYNWLDLDFAVIQNQRSENIQKIINLIKQFDNQSGIIFPDNIQYNDLSLFHFYTNQNSLWYARFNQTGVNLWTLPVLHPQAVLTMSDELNSIINNCLICNV